MSEKISENKKSEIKPHHWLSPIFHTLTPQHAAIYQRYQTLRVFVDFSAAACFVSGSILFLFSNTGPTAGRLFLVGSLLFAVKPTLDLIRAFHLSRI